MKSRASKFDPIVVHNLFGQINLVGAHKKSARENTYPTFEDAHIYVRLEALYILSTEKGRRKGDHCWVGAAQKLFHDSGM